MSRQMGASPTDSRRGERGASAVKVILSLAILALVAHTAWIFIPIYVSVYDFNSQVENQAQYGAPKNNETIVKSLVAYAAERHLPVTKDNVKVTRSQTRLNVEADYTVPVKTLFYTYDWKVHSEYSAVLF